MGCTNCKEKVAELQERHLEKKNSKNTASTTETDVDVKVLHDEPDELQAESKINRALAAKRRADIFDESFEPEKVDIEFANNPLVDKAEGTKSFLITALNKNILFRDLTQDQMDRILHALSKKKVRAEKVLIKEGDKGDRFYIVEKGVFSVSIEGEKKGECVKGDSFGELALLYNCPRAATVKCEQEGVVWVLERTAFRHIIAGTISRKQNDVRKALRSVSILSSLNNEQLNRISDAVETVHFNAGETIIKKGDEGNIFFMIKKGQVKCTQAGSGTRESAVDLILGEGEYFGERALLKKEPRAANVIAMVDTDCLVLDREAFNQLLGPLKEVMDYNLGMRVLGSVPLLSQLSQPELRKLMKALKEERFKKGTMIIKQNDHGSKFYLIKEGEAQVTKSVDGVHEPAQVAQLGQGDYFGEGALLKDEPRGANVIASTEEVVCLTLERNSFEKLLGPLTKIMKRELDTRDDQTNHIVKQKQKAVEETLKLSDLKMLKTLGTGTFGRVKLVECAKLNRTYALKILQKAQVVAYRQQQNVMNEKDILLECDHPFILRLYRTFKDKHSLYLLLELVQGGELFSLLHIRGGALANSDARFYAACVIDALEYLHNRKIVYRDLKPENLMISADGYIKVVDFGFAKRVEDKTYTLCGTPEYLSPELVLGKGHNHAVDNWAVGILIFEMLTGASPFADHHNNDHMVICKNIVRGKVDFPRKFPDKAKDLVTRLLTRDAHMRLGSLKNGTADLKTHVWFKSLDFNELVRKRVKAPWIPPIKNHLDTSHFEDYEEQDYVEPYKSRGSNWDENF